LKNGRTTSSRVTREQARTPSAPPGSQLPANRPNATRIRVRCERSSRRADRVHAIRGGEHRVNHEKHVEQAGPRIMAGEACGETLSDSPTLRQPAAAYGIGPRRRSFRRPPQNPNAPDPAGAPRSECNPGDFPRTPHRQGDHGACRSLNSNGARWKQRHEFRNLSAPPCQDHFVPSGRSISIFSGGIGTNSGPLQRMPQDFLELLVP